MRSLVGVIGVSVQYGTVPFQFYIDIYIYVACSILVVVLTWIPLSIPKVLYKPKYTP